MNGTDFSPAGSALLNMPSETDEQRKKRLSSIAALQQRLGTGSPAGQMLGGMGSYGMALGG